MDLDNFLKKFAEQVEESEVRNIRADANFKLLDTWDSLTLMSVQVMVEEEFNVKLSPQDFKSATTIAELYYLIQKKFEDK